VAHALESGLRVRTLLRHQVEGLFPASVECRIGDIRDEAAVTRAVRDVEFVLHLAAVLHRVGPAVQRTTEYDAINNGATRLLLKHAAASGVQRLVLFSTIAVYGKRAHVVADEATVPSPDSPYSMSKLDAERAVLEQEGPGGVPLAVVLRLAAVYGPRLKGNYRTLLEHLAAGRPMPLLPGSNRRTLVFDEDVAVASLLAAREARAAGRVFDVTDGTTHTLREIAASMCRALGRQPPRFGLPAALAGAAVAAVRPALSGRLAALGAQVEKFTEDIAVDGNRIQAELGFVPRVSLDEGWRRTVAALRALGEIA